MSAQWAKDDFEKLLAGKQGAPFAAKLREGAFQSFEENGFPSRKNEDWKYTSLVQFEKLSFHSPGEDKGGFSDKELTPYVLLKEGYAARFVFMNGHFSEELSMTGSLPKGVSVERLAPSLDGNGNGTQSFVESHFGKYSSCKEHAFVALNTALLRDGVCISVAKGVQVTAPIELIFISNSEGGANYPRVLLVADESSEVAVVENYIGATQGTYLTSAVTEIVAAENAKVSHVKVQRESEEAYHFHSLQLKQSSNSHVSTSFFSFGGGLVRNEISPLLDGEGIESHLLGLSLGHGTQHIDNHTVIDHAKPHSESNELFKGIYWDKAKGVFNGTIIVRPDAQKTNAIQSNNSLILSDDASIDTRPQLKIWADDVKCTHGATIGQLDEDALFYIRSRGIGPKQARSLLIRAFAGDVVSQVPIPSLREELDKLLSEKLEESYQVD